MKTAVEWLVEQLDVETVLTRRQLSDVINQAKEMEKEQIVDAHFEGQCDETEGYPKEIAEQYYNETFKQQKQ
jgi:predicted anti-sigma-YlaC factor YlaD